MGILDDFKNACNEDGIDIMAEIDKQNKMMDEYNTHGTINGKVVEIKKSEDYDGIDYECERESNMDEYPDGELVGEDNSQQITIGEIIDPTTAFKQAYPKFHEEDLTIIKSKDYVPVVVQAYCPQCGKPIVSTAPIMFNPYTMEKIGRYDCECGWKANLDFAYPRLIMVNKNSGEELEVYTK